ncbi:hypothetical protein D3C72_2149450 [compost metagenome]
MLPQSFKLLGVQAGVAEHPFLVTDATVVQLRSPLLQAGGKNLAHLLNALTHACQFALPLLTQIGVRQQGFHNLAAMGRRAGVTAADQRF